MPTQAEMSIWYGSHGPTPAVISAEANNDVHPSAKPNPGPSTRPEMISRKKTSSTPESPGEIARVTALTALSTPSSASTRASRPPSVTSASTTATTTGSSARNRNGGSTRVPSGTLSSSGQTSIMSPANDASPSTASERRDSGTAATRRSEAPPLTPSPTRRPPRRPAATAGRAPW